MAIDGLAGGQVDEQPPEVVAIVEPGEPALADPLAERLEGAQGQVLLVVDRRRAPQGASFARARSTSVA